MNKEEKIKIQIQRLQAQSDYHKFEYSQISNYFIGIVAMLLAVYIPLITTLNKWYYTIILAVFLLGSLWYSNKKLKKHFKKNTDKIEELSKKIDGLYEDLLK